MFAELGLIALIIALCFCVLQVLLVVTGQIYGQTLLLKYSIKPVSAILFVLILLAFVLLVLGFLNNDFTISYVASNSNKALPWYYKISATWGGHEGSMLLWVLICCVWALAVSIFEKRAPLEVKATIMSTLAIIIGGSLLFLIATSNPFERLLPFAPVDGQDLNPLLQDFGLIIHPPILYMGYVGFSVAFAYAIGALVHQRMDRDWASWIRPWTNTAWAFLTVGIALGSWWAYYELGWGGWWFWDPVENASLMPWIAGTALIHSLSVLEQRNMFQRWVLLLAISTFSLSLLGTFLVRSGVLTSIHAFATDPERGIFILMFLVVIIGSSLGLYGWRLNGIEFEPKPFGFISREMGLLTNNLVMMTFLFIVLLGTLYPLFYEVSGLGNLSVGAPYFNFFTVILVVPLASGLILATHLSWKKGSVLALKQLLMKPVVLGILLGIALPLIYAQYHILDQLTWHPFVGGALGFCILMPIIFDVIRKLINRQWRAQHFKYWGMQCAHLGLALMIIGVSYNASFEVDRDVSLKAGDSYQLGSYLFELKRFKQVKGENYTADEARFRVIKGDVVYDISAQKRLYHSGGNLMTEAGINGNLWRDIYISMGEAQRDNQQLFWAFRLHIKPFIRWVWLGAVLVALGALLALVNRRKTATIKS